MSQDEKLICVIAYIFPFQFVAIWLAKYMSLYKDEVKKQIKNSLKLYGLLMLINVPALAHHFLQFNLNLVFEILFFILFLISMFLVIKIFIDAIKIFKK